MTSMPLPIPASKSTMPTKADPYKADRAATDRAAEQRQASRAASKESTKTSSKADQVEDKKDTAASNPESFLSYMLAGLMGSQNFAATTPVAQDREPISVPVSFGGTFNMDPSMLVLPEGVDAASLVLNSPDGTQFSPELLAALTPGVPTDVNAIGVVNGQVVAQLEGDPRLIATGLDPAQMQALVSRLTAMANDQAAAGAVPAQMQSNVATVSFLPDTDLPVPVQSQVPGNGVMSSVPGTEVICFAPTVAATDDGLPDALTIQLAQGDTAETAQPVSQEADDFDPLEFRLAMKSSPRFGADPYATATDDAPAPSAPPKLAPIINPNAGQVMRGSMQSSGQTATPPIAALPGDTLGDGSIKTYLDPLMPQLPPASATPLQTGSLASNPVLQNVTAVQSHPTTQAVAAMINRASQQGNGTQTLAVQLDPPELGKMQLKMKYEKGEPLRVHVVLEKADTMAMFQRDAHALENALNQAGLKTDGSSLTFDLGSQGTFGQAMNDQTGGSGQNQPGWTADAAAMAEDVTDTQLSIHIDPKTGLAHYNMMV